MRLKKILIVGANSYIGSSLAKHISDTYSVSLLARSNANNVSNCIWYLSDLGYDNPFEKLLACEPFDFIIWCSQSKKYQQDIHNYRDLVQINILGLQKTLDFCVSNKTKNFIYLSSGTVYQNPSNQTYLTENSPIDHESYYGFTKHIAEQICQHYAQVIDTKITILRLFTVYGSKQKDKIIPRMLSMVQNEQEINLNQGIGMIFNALYIEDLLNILCLFIEDSTDHKLSIYNVANPELVQLNDVCNLIGDLENKQVTIFATEKPITYSLADVTRLINRFKSINFTPIAKGISNIVKQELPYQL